MAGQVTPGLYPAFSFVPRYLLGIGPNSLQIPQVGQGLPLSSHWAHSPSQAGTRGFLCVPSQALLRLLPLPLFLQLVHLLLVVTVQCNLDGKDGVLVVAVPFHAVAVQVAGVFHSDELLVLQLCDVFHHSSHREMYCRGNGAVTGMTLMSMSIFTVEQVGVDGDGSVTEIQKEQFIGQREEILPGIPAHWNQMLIQQSTLFEFLELLCGHVLAHVQLGCQLIRTGQDIFFAVGVEIAEIGEGSEGLGLQVPLPNFIGD